jgi:hypothetical protein
MLPARPGARPHRRRVAALVTMNGSRALRGSKNKLRADDGLE